ncbi:ITM2B isoform 4, partial [Pan troglodytes]
FMLAGVILGGAYLYKYFALQSFSLVAQTGVQWRDLGSLHPLSPGQMTCTTVE